MRVGLAVLLAAALYGAPGKVSKEKIKVDGKSRDYYLYVPEKLPESGKAPVLMLLHDRQKDGSSLIGPWTRMAAREGIILVAPNSQGKMGWTAPLDGPGFLYEILEALKKTHPVDPRRVYLFGHADGAVFGMFVSFWASEYFAAASAHAGTFREEAEARMAERAKRKIPIQLIVGTDDRHYPVGLFEVNAEFLKFSEFEIDLQVVPDHKHDYAPAAETINPIVWEFLSGKALDGEPRYESPF